MQTHWIDGREFASLSPHLLEVRDPATEALIDRIPSGCEADANAAVAAAKRAFPSWGAISPTQRKTFLRNSATRMEAHQDEISDLLTLENGKPIGDSRAEVKAAIDALFSFSELAVHLRSGVFGAPVSELNFQHREPRGVVACIVPWNFPLATALGNITPALATGNTVVWKPSEKTPLSSRMLMELVFCDLPRGVLNVLLGDGPNAGEHLVSHRDVDAVAFIGSEKTGRRIGMLCGMSLKKAILELGGKDPMIVDETVNISRAAKLAAGAAFFNAGQICTSTERIYVQKSIAQEFTMKLVSEAQAIKIGSGMETGVIMGPLVDENHLQKVSGQVDDAVRRGAEVLCGGTRLNRPGYFYPPTVLISVPAESSLMKEETFGPVAPVFTFDHFEEAIAMANDSQFGLASIVCTESSSRAIRALQEIKAGTVKINTMRGRAPGVASEPCKASGAGYGSGADILLELTRARAVHWRGELA